MSRPVIAPAAASPQSPGPAPRFSVVTACYNSASTIAASVDSALEQVPAPYEVIICDDGSTDDLAAALAPFEGRITVIRQENGGEGAAKATAAAAATGDFVVVLDADDRFLPGRLAAISDAIVARPDLDIVTTDAWLDVDGRRVGRYYDTAVDFPAEDQRSAIIRGNFIFGLAAVRRSRLVEVGGFDPSLRTVADWDCWLRLVLTGSLVGLVDEPLAVYQQHAGGLSAQRGSYRWGRVRVVQKLLGNPALTDAERAHVARRLVEVTADAHLTEVEHLVLTGDGRARPRAARAAFVRGVPAPTRLRLLASAVAPAAARRRLEARQATGGFSRLRRDLVGGHPGRMSDDSSPTVHNGVVPGTTCRFCRASSLHTVADLGMSPLCESFLPADRVEAAEVFYPLHARVCDSCWLVQVPELVPPEEIFTEYAYFSAFSDSWVEHARSYTEMITGRLGLDGDSFVVELASNDGYLLQHFVTKGIPVLGIDPAANIAPAAEERGVRTMVAFFGLELARKLAEEERRADLIVGNNVLAQVPDLNDFVAGIAALLEPNGVVTLEFPHLLTLIEGHQFDTIYHEHFSYFSLLTTSRIFEAHGLTLFDVEEIPTHGGSLRVYGCPAGARPVEAAVPALIAREESSGLTDLAHYRSFADRVAETKHRLLEFLIAERRAGREVAGYGAPGKGNTLLNYCGIRTDLIAYTVDRNPYKHGMFLPGTHIPIHPPERMEQSPPDTVLILPWNLEREIAEQLRPLRERGTRLYVPIPTVREVAS